jgi:tetratricopeptide (TPR) repeat protein
MGRVSRFPSFPQVVSGNPSNKDSLIQGSPITQFGDDIIKVSFLLFYLLLFPFSLSFASPQDSFDQGNKAYAEGQYLQAAGAYESAATGGLQNWVVQYNLGNACYKAGSLGKAVAAYDRAFRLNPGNSDVVFNLNLALTKAGDPLLPGGALASLCWRIYYAVPLDLLTLLVSALLIVLVSTCGLFFLGRRTIPAEAAFALFAALALSGTWCGLRIEALQQKEAVIIVPAAEVRSGPNLSSPANFNIPEGRRVLLLDEQEPVSGWLEIGVPSEGLKGWIPDSSVETI